MHLAQQLRRFLPAGTLGISRLPHLIIFLSIGGIIPVSKTRRETIGPAVAPQPFICE